MKDKIRSPTLLLGDVSSLELTDNLDANTPLTVPLDIILGAADTVAEATIAAPPPG